MLVYRICQNKYAHSLSPPGIAARWNTTGQRVIYTGGTLALSCLEMLVHKSGSSLLAGSFSVSIINLADSMLIEEITSQELVLNDRNWHRLVNYPITQELGDRWLQRGKSVILKVPSAIIDREYDYLLNPDHAEFSKVHIASVSKFLFDPRLKADP